MQSDNCFKPHFPFSQVNHSPSFHTDAPLDKEVKEGLLYDTFNLIDLYANDKKKCLEEDRRRVKERLLCRQKPKDLSITSRDDDTREKYEVHLETYEMTHKGGFRRVYPLADEADYDKFFDQSTSLCAETAASRARTDLARQHKEEIEAKQKAKEEMRRKLSHGQGVGRERSEELRPESPSHGCGVERKQSGTNVRILNFKRRGTNFHLPLYSAGKRRELQQFACVEEGEQVQHITECKVSLAHHYLSLFPIIERSQVIHRINW